MRKFILITAIILTQTYALTVDQILDKVEENEEPQSSRTEMTQIIHPNKGEKRKSKLISFSIDKGDKGFVEYLSPKSVKGMKMLTLNDGDDIWVYFPRTNRKRKIAGSSRKGSMNGSDFSYEDLSQSDKREDYKFRLLGEEKKEGHLCYKIEATAKSDDETYKRLLQWVDKERFLALFVEFYDEDNELWKELTLKNLKRLGKYWVADEVIMTNVQKGSKTVILTDKQEFDIEIPKSKFTQRNLSK